jgi:hypothetical protein
VPLSDGNLHGRTSRLRPDDKIAWTSPWETSDRAELRHYRKYDLPTAAQFGLWEKSGAFKRWRRMRAMKGAYRDALLNTDPDIDDLEHQA